MASNDDRRWRDDFPQLFAAWMMTQTAARRASVHAREWSALNTALVAGGIALFLGFVLVFLPPKQAQSNTEIQPLLDTSLAGKASSPLQVDVAWLQQAAEWDEPDAQWKSTSPIQAVSFALTDEWNAAFQRRELAVGAPEPYWMRAPQVEFEGLQAALAASETPAAFATSEFAGQVGVSIDRSEAMPTENGALEYTLHVTNLGRDAVEHVRVIETLGLPEHVLNTTPPASMTPEGAFIWELSDLRGFETRDLVVTLDSAMVNAPLSTVAALDVETQVATKTLVYEAALPPEVTEPIRPELAQPEPQPAFEFASEPIAPVLAEDDGPIAPDWTTHDPRVAPEDLAPIEPLFSQDIAPEEVVPLPAEDARQFVPIEPEFTPEPPPQQEIADEPVVPAPQENPAPRPLPLPTRTPRPVLSLAGSSREAVRAGDVLTTVYEIANTGDAPAEGVVLTVFVPPQLEHQHGEEVEHRIDRLLPGQTHRARLKTRASTTGTARLDAVLSVQGQAEDEHVLSIRVLGSRPAAAARP